VVIALVCATEAQASTTLNGPLTLNGAVDYALGHNATIAQRFAAVHQAEDNLARQRLVAFPTVNGSLQSALSKSANFGGSFQIIGLAQNQVFSQNTAQISTNYNLQSGGFALLALASARAQLAGTQADLANAEDQLATSVTNAFYTVVQKQAIVAVDETDVAYQSALVEAAKVKERAGVAAGVDVLRAQVAQVKSRSTLAGASADVDTARENLAQLIGTSLDTVFTFPKEISQPPLPKQPVADLETMALRTRPDVKSARESVFAATYVRRGFDRELFPQVQIGAAFGNQFSPTTVQFNPVTGQPLPRQGTPGFWTLTATSSFTLPLVDYGARHFERVNDDAQLASAQTNLESTSVQAQADVRQSYRSAQTALEQVDYANEEARLGTESARIAQLQYAHGIIALSDVLLAQEQSITAQSDFVNARVSYVDAVVKLRISLGIYDARSAVADLR